MTLLPMISSIGPYAIGQPASMANNANWPSANRILYVPVRILEDCTVLRVYWVNGGSVTGNVNAGLYSQAGTKQFETGSTAQSGTNQAQFVNITDTPVTAGFYYLALQHSSTGQITRGAPNLYDLRARGMMEEDAASFALPSTMTPENLSVAYHPSFGLDLRG